MTQDEIIRMARELATTHGVRMCDEDGDTHGEELYCVGIEDIAEIIKQVAAHEREKWEQALPIAMDAMMLQEREACAKVCETEELGGVFGKMCAAAIRARGELIGEENV